MTEKDYEQVKEIEHLKTTIKLITEANKALSQENEKLEKKYQDLRMQLNFYSHEPEISMYVARISNASVSHAKHPEGVLEALVAEFRRKLYVHYSKEMKNG